MITLNLLQYSRTNPILSAHVAINRNFNFNATPLAPPGTKVLVHESSYTQPYFSTHAVDGWYTGPSLHHYLCYHCYTPSTSSTRHTDTVEFLPKQFDFPRITNTTYLCQAAEDIIRILSNKKAISYHPSLYFWPTILNAYLQVARILQHAVQTPPTPPPHLPLNIDKIPSSLPRVHTPSLLRVNPLPLPRVPTSTPHQYPTIHTRHQKPTPIIATAAAVIDTNTGAKPSLQNLRSSPKKATWEIYTANKFSAWHRAEINTVSPPYKFKAPTKYFLSPNMPSPRVKKLPTPTLSVISRFPRPKHIAFA